MENKKTMFIDRDEVEEMLCEYYDFSEVTEDQWDQIDALVKGEVERRGIDPTSDYDTYAAICDGCVGRVIG